MFGFLNVYKPVGKTSHDVVAILRRVTKVKQIGHTGTLDPFAEGVLPICIGKATRLIEYLKDDKAYIGTIQLGKSTTTYDIEGDVVNESDKIVTQEEIENALVKFNGEIEQFPPMYSAIKVNGKKLYEYARDGKDVELKPRRVNVKEIKINNYNLENRKLEVYIACSKGTYIRSIANDLGEALGTYGHLIKLVRVQAGNFVVNDAIKLEELDSVEKVQENLIYPLVYLDYPRYNLNPDELEKVSHGMPIIPTENFTDGIVVLTDENKLVAVGEASSNQIKCNKVFI